MPRGQVLNIPNQQSVLTTTLSREEKASIAILNPNDGVLYVKLNGFASNTPTLWDWKVPSQSYCQLPGPWQSLGVYYVDQSGTGTVAQVNVYESDSQIAIPSFIAIGRAVQTAGTTMDITTGNQPQNPTSGTVRLWADGNGDLHIVNSTGVDNLVYDSSNIGAVALGGDLSGTISVGTVNLRNNSAISARDTGNTTRGLIALLSDNNVVIWNSGNNTIRFLNQAGTVELAHLDTAGNWVVGGGVTVAGAIQMNDGQSIFWGATTRVLVASNSFYIDIQGGGFNVRAANRGYAGMFGVDNLGNASVGASLSITNNLTVSGNAQVNAQLAIGGAALSGSNGDVSVMRGASGTGYIFYGNGGNYLGFDGGQFYASKAFVSAAGIQATSSLQASGNLIYFQDANYYFTSGPVSGGGYTISRTINGFLVQEPGGAYRPIGASAFNVNSIRAVKDNIVPLIDALDVVLNPALRCVSYTEKSTGNPSIGFIADDWIDYLPEVVASHPDGEVYGLNYNAIAAITFEALKDLAKRVELLENKV